MGLAEPTATKALYSFQKSLTYEKKPMQESYLHCSHREACTLPLQHITRYFQGGENVVYITNCVWAVVYSFAQDLAGNRLHSGIQSNVDGERQRLEPF